MPVIAPAELPTLADPLASDFRVKLPPVVKVALVPTVTVPEVVPAVMASAVPKVAVALEFKVKSFSDLEPLVKFKVPAVPPIVKFEVEEPVKVPVPLTAPLMVSVLEPIDNVVPDPNAKVPIVLSEAKTGLLVTPVGIVILAPLLGTALSSQFPEVS